MLNYPNYLHMGRGHLVGWVALCCMPHQRFPETALLDSTQADIFFQHSVLMDGHGTVYILQGLLRITAVPPDWIVRPVWRLYRQTVLPEVRRRLYAACIEAPTH